MGFKSGEQTQKSLSAYFCFKRPQAEILEMLRTHAAESNPAKDRVAEILDLDLFLRYGALAPEMKLLKGALVYAK